MVFSRKVGTRVAKGTRKEERAKKARGRSKEKERGDGEEGMGED